MGQIIQISIWPRGLINCFLIKGTNKHILVDTGIPKSENKILKQLQDLNISPCDIGLIVITHAHIDHFGSAAILSKLFNIPILGHEQDSHSYRNGKADLTTLKTNKKQWWLFRQLIKDQTTIPFEPQIILKDEEIFSLHKYGISGKILHTPGHTPGSLSIILENGECIIMDMMASGILLGGVLFHSRIKHPPFHDDLVALKQSFQKILNENGKIYYLGHGGPVYKSQVLEYYHKYLE